jgi:peptide chain release factor subunit 3
MGQIESGCCRVGDTCILMPNRTQVEVTNIYYEGIEKDSCVCGEFVRLKLTNVEEEVSMKNILLIY